MKRSEMFPRHSNNFGPSLRIPSPLCACGRPKIVGKSHKANRHSVLSALGSSRKRSKTVGRINSGLLKHLPQQFGSEPHQLTLSFETLIFFLGGSLEARKLLRRYLVFALSIIGGFYFHFAQSNDVSPSDNPNVLSSSGGIKPAAQIFPSVRDCESLHNVFITPQQRPFNIGHSTRCDLCPLN